MSRPRSTPKTPQPDRAPNASVAAETSPDGATAPASSASLPGPLAFLQANDAGFAALAAGVLALIAPGDALGRMLAELLVLAAGRLRNAALLEPEGELPGLDWCRYQSLAERNFRAAARDLRIHLNQLARNAPKPGRPADTEPEAPPAAPEPPPVPESTPEEIAEASANWRRHIALVRSISEEWPIILRLRRQVEDVAAWLLDGHSDETLMRWYPGLNRADIAACRSCDAEGLCGPFDPADGPYPPGLPVLDDLPPPDDDPPGP